MPKYEVIKGAESEIEFMGLYGQYVWGMFIGLAASIFTGLMLFLLLPSPTLAGFMTLLLAGGVVFFSYRWNKQYGRWGREKEAIQKKLPHFVIVQRPVTLLTKKNAHQNP